MRRLLPVVLLALAVGGLNGCAWLRGKDNVEPPAELPEFEPRVQLQSLWERDMGAGIDAQFLRLCPAVDGGRVFAADRKGKVSAVDAASGKGIWETRTGIAVSSGVGVGDGLVLVGSSEADLVALDWNDGHEVWRTTLTSEILSVPAAGNGKVVVQTVDGKLAGLNAADGKRVWVLDRSVPVLSLRGTSSPVLVQGAVVAAFDDGKLAVLDLERGLPVWETGIAIARGRSELERMVDIDAPPQVWGGTIYVAAYQGRVAAVEGNSGRVLWSRDMSSAAGVGVDFSQVYVTDDSSDVWALERGNGASVWKQDKFQRRALTAPVPFGEYVVVADFEGYVHLLARSDGAIVGRTRVDRKGVLATPVVDDDTLFVYGNGGKLAAYKIRGAGD